MLKLQSCSQAIRYVYAVKLIDALMQKCIALLCMQTKSRPLSIVICVSIAASLDQVPAQVCTDAISCFQASLGTVFIATSLSATIAPAKICLRRQ